MPNNTNKVDVIVNFQGKADDIEKTVKGIQNEINKIKLPSLQTSQVESAFDKVNSKIEKYREALDKPVGSTKDLNNQAKAAEELEAAYSGLVRVLEKTTNLDTEKLLEGFNSKKVKDINELTSAVQEEIDREKELEGQRTELANVTNEIIEKEKELNKLQDKKKYTKKVTKGTLDNAKISRDNIKAELKAAQESEKYQKAVSYQNKYGTEGKTEKAQYYRNIIQNVNDLSAAAQQADEKVESMENRFNFDNLRNSIANLKSGKEEIANFITELENSSTSVDTFKQKLKTLGVEAVNGVDLNKISSYKELIEVLQSANNAEVSEFLSKIKSLNLLMEEGQTKVKGNSDAFREFSDSEKEVESQTQKLSNEVSQFTQRFTRFFSLYYLGDQFVKAIRNAYSAIKELDEAMTETAVVTDFSVGDMWDQLPEYTAQANELGVATKEAYEAATLYYQQGLDTNTVNQLTTSTLKMARIASLDAATATDRMTNALRGFNMELNETNAERVADVYSELAAVSATDVDELSVAMTKTASIASSANMEFENTAAFLAQMLETTRESAETAGTALKTVIGRFTEVKELYSTGQLTGTDDEGDAIDVNKVSEALRTAGIDMNEFFTGAKGLDEIFMELAEKWDTLSIVQQRYIATQAAGSRQQSRFIAMLGDYDRLLELQSDAYGANGASQEQYEKTMESLETKLQKLENAWNQFTMTLMNSDFVKGAVDVLTTLLNALNNIISKISGGNGIIAAIEALGITILSVGTIIKANLSLGIEKKLTGALTKALLKGIKQSEAPAAAQSYQSGYTAGLAYSKGYEAGANNIDMMQSQEFLDWFNDVSKGTEQTTESFGKLGKALLGIGVAIGIVVAAYKLLEYYHNNFSNEGKYQKAKDQVDLLATAYEDADAKCQTLLDTIDAYSEASAKTDTLVEGTKAYTSALIEANEQAQELITNYGLVAGQDWIVENGKIVIDSGAQDRIIKEEQQKVADAQAAKTSATAIEYDEKTLSAIEVFSKSVDSFSESNAESGKVLAAMGTGAAAGAAGGAIIGGVPGAVVGALAGSVAGAVAGNIDVEKNGAATAVEKESLQKLAEAVNESSDSMLAFSNAVGKYESDNDNSELLKVFEAVGITDQGLIDSLLEDTEALQNLMNAVNANTEALKAQQKLAFEEKYAERLSQDDIINSSYISEKYGQYASTNGQNYLNRVSYLETLSKDDIYEEYLKNILGDDTAVGATGENYRVRDRGGTNVTIQQYVDGEWQDVSGKTNNLSKDAMIKEVAANQLLEEASSKITEWSEEAKEVDKQLSNLGISGEDNQDKRNEIATSIARGETADLTSLTRAEIAELQGNIGAITDAELKSQIQKGIDEYESIRQSTNLQASQEWGENYDTLMSEKKQTALDTADMSDEDFAAFAEGLADSLGIASEEAEKLALREIEVTNASEAMKDVFEENEDVLKAGKKAGAAYYTALNKIQAQTELLLGAPLSEEWLEEAENLEKLEKAINGDTAALKELQMEAAREVVVSMDLDETSAQQLYNFIDTVEGQDITIGTSISAVDDEDFIASLNTMMANGQATAEQVNQYLSSMGYTPDITMTKIKQPTTYSASLKIAGVEVGQVEGEVNNEISVPQINGTGTVYNGQTKTITPSSNKSSSSSSGGSSNTSEWKNEYDWLYNLEQAITEELRKQEKLQADLKDLEEDENASGQEKLDNLKEQLKSLERQRQLEELMRSKRYEEMDRILSDNAQYSQYATYNKESKQVEIDWDAIESIMDEDVYNAVEEYIKSLEDVEKEIDDADDAIEDIDDSTREILDYYHDDYVDMENRVLDALVILREKEIDSLENVSDAIDDANSELINSINTALDKQRQQRDNEDKEQELTDLEQRIAYLSMDTSGANQLEIMDLQNQLDDARQDYTDSLIDQKINELKEQNDKASEERQAQIELMKTQLDYERTNGLLWSEVHDLINNAFTNDGVPIENSSLENVLKSAEGWASLSAQQKEDWAGSLNSSMTNAWTYMKNGNLNTTELAGIKAGVDNVAAQIGANKAASTKIDDTGDTTQYADYTGTTQNPGTKSVIQTNSSKGLVGVAEAYEQYKKDHIKQLPTNSTSGTGITESAMKSGIAINGKYYTTASGGYSNVTAYAGALTGGPNLNGKTTSIPVKNGTIVSRWAKNNAIYLKVKTNLGNYWIRQDSLYQKYATGGLNTTTGPAWLDGTKSRPEYVLNADQTQAFLNLVDILDGFSNGSYSNTTNSQSYGDFNVNIQVDQLANDYDTDKLVKQIKKELYESSTYRNFNNVTRLR